MKQGRFFRACRAVYRLFHPRWKAQVRQPAVPTVYICSHQNMQGPLTTLAFLPFAVHPWILSVFFDRESCKKQYAEYTFSKRYGMPEKAANALAGIVSGVVSALVRSTGAIPVWRGDRKRITETFSESLSALKRGESILIYPDIQYAQVSGEMGRIYEGFILLGKMYARETGKSLRFAPLYCDRNAKRILEGTESLYNPAANVHAERTRIAAELVENVNRMAKNAGKVPQA